MLGQFITVLSMQRLLKTIYVSVVIKASCRYPLSVLIFTITTIGTSIVYVTGVFTTEIYLFIYLTDSQIPQTYITMSPEVFTTSKLSYSFTKVLCEDSAIDLFLCRLCWMAVESIQPQVVQTRLCVCMTIIQVNVWQQCLVILNW